MKNKYISAIICTFLLLLNLNIVDAQDDFTAINNIESINQKIKQTAENTKTLESDFIQKKHLSMLEETLISKGHFCYKKENKIRWEYTDPIQYLIIINTGKFIIKDGDKISEYDTKSNAVFKEINNIVNNSVQGKILESEAYEIDIKENDKYFLAVLIPKDEGMKSFLSSIQIYFEKADFTVSQIKIMESSEDYTSISFINKKMNEEISENNFTIQ